MRYQRQKVKHINNIEELINKIKLIFILSADSYINNLSDKDDFMIPYDGVDDQRGKNMKTNEFLAKRFTRLQRVYQEIEKHLTPFIYVKRFLLCNYQRILLYNFMILMLREYRLMMWW